MSDIMSLLVFQGSRQQLLSLLMDKINSVKAHRNEHKARQQPEAEAERRYIDNMLNAFEAAGEHCERLEYWSDLREMSRKGDILEDAAQGWGVGDGSRQSGNDKGKRKARAVDDVFHTAEENLPEELAAEEKDDEQVEAAKKQAESRQLAEVGELSGGEHSNVKCPTKLTSFSDDEDGDKIEHEGDRHEA